MRISTKITLALTASSLAIFGLYGVRLVQREREELFSALEDSSQLLARGLQVSIENALRDGQPSDVQEVVQELHLLDPRTEALVQTPDGRKIASTGQFSAAARELALAARESGELELLYLPEDDPETLVMAIPMEADEGKSIGGMLLSQPLDSLQRDLSRTTLGVAASVLAIALSAGLLGHVLGRIYIDRPLRALVDAMRAVRLGDLRSGVRVRREDEISAVGIEFNLMVRELSDTRERLQQESDSRLRAEAALQQANRLITVGQLGASLAHEIGSPLQVLAGRARQLMANADQVERVHQNARIIAEQSDRIAGIIDQLLRLVRDLPAPSGRADIVPAVGSVVELLAYEARRRGCVIEFEVAPDTPWIEADPRQVQQIALNLLTNALAASSEGGRIRTTIGPARLTRPYDDPVPACRLRIEDQGQGFSPEDVRRAFEPFFTTRGPEGGTGLGLTVVKSLVERHSGTVELRSRPGEGTCVDVLLPVDQPRSVGRRVQSPPREGTPHG